MTKIYLVFGHTTSNSGLAEPIEWFVKAFLSLEEAEKFSTLANQEANLINLRRPNKFTPSKEVSKYDSALQLGPNGAYYAVVEGEIDESLFILCSS